MSIPANWTRPWKRFFLDTEFVERGADFPVTLISIGIACEDGRTFYAVSSEFKDEDCSDWVKANVLPHLGESERLTRDQIASGIRAFVADQTPEFWGYYSDYDWVVFAQIFGTMMNLPDGWPMFCLDLKQMAYHASVGELPPQDSTEHNALNDAIWNQRAYNYIAENAL